MFDFGVRPTRWIPLTLILVLALTTALSAGEAAASREIVVYEGSLDRQDLAWDTDAFGKTYPTLDGARHLTQPGLPRLPVREILLAVPLDYNVAGAVIEPLGTMREKRAAPVALSAPNVASDGELVYARHMERTEDVFPATWGHFSGSHVWRGYKLVSVDIYPVREVQTDQGIELEYLNDFAVRLILDEGPDTVDVAVRLRQVPGEAADARRVVTALVANPEAVPGLARQDGVVVTDKSGGFAPTTTPSLTGSAVTFLIITSDALASEFQVLADYKTAQGIPTVVSTVEDIVAGNRNGADVQETMRLYIRDAYEKWGIEYVLLGGDSDVLPPRYINNSFYPTVGFTPIPCDLYFACLDGNWNANANDEFGEPAKTGDTGDLVDFAEEIYIGRATVSTPADVSVFVGKNIKYETAPAGQEWANRALFAAEVLFPEDWPEGNYITLDGAQYANQQVNDYIVPCTDMEYTRMYQTDTLYPMDAQLNLAALIDTLNTGNYGVVNQIGHGYYFNMSVADRNFMTTDADQLVNDNLFMIYALNCASGAFDNSCLLERFVQNPIGGSVCSLGSARAAFPNASNNYQQEFFAQLYCYGEFRVGRLQALSRLPFIGSTTANFVDRWTFENYTLLGDPTLAIWSGIPAGLTIAAPTGLTLGPQLVNVTVEDADGPVEGAQVCLAMGDEAYVVGFTDVTGQVILDFLPVSTGNAVLTVTGRNLVHTSQDIPVTSGSAYLALDAVPVIDDGSGLSAGNGNGVAEAGETVDLLPILRETGDAGTVDISGVFATLEAGLTFTVAGADFPDVGAGGTTTAQTPFTLQMDPGIADGTVMALQMTTDSSGTIASVSEWAFEVRAPAPEVVALDWDDSVWGNGDGILDDGERVAVTVALKNYGTGRADQVTGTLTSADGNVVLYDTAASWNNLEHLDEMAGSSIYSLSLTDALLGGVCTLSFIDNYGRTFQHDFTLDRPATPAEITTDTTQGADVIALYWDPPAEGILGYHVYRSLAPGGPFERVNTDLVVGTSYFRDDNLDQLTRYYYQVAAVDSSFVPGLKSPTISQSTSPAELSGFPVEFGIETSGHLAVGDVDGDGDPEIVLGAEQVYVWHHTGLELLDGDNDSQTLGPFTGFPVNYGFTPGGITLENLDDTIGMDMIVSEQTPGTKIHIYGRDGNEIPGWPQDLTNKPGTDWNWTTPAAGDIDGDGDSEIVVATLNGWIHAWHHDGTEVRDGDGDPATNGPFYFRTGAQWEWSRSGPALADLDGDGARDIIFGTRTDDTGTRRLMAIKHDGTDVAGFPYTANGAIGCDPAVGDIDGDGDVEIVFFDQARYVYVVHHDGTDYPGFPANMGYTSTLEWVTSPALGDVDGDGMLEIVYTPIQSGSLSRIVVVDTDHVGGTSGQVLAGFPVVLPGSSEGSPVIGDIDGDQSPEILQGIGGGDENSPYNLYAFHSDGTQADGFPITLTGPLMPSPVIADIDSDLDVDIVYGGWDTLVHVWDMPFAYDRRYVPWPTFGGNWRRDGNHLSLALLPTPEDGEVPPANFTVGRPYPNPFNPSTTLRLYLPVSGEVDLGVYDVKGRRIRSLHTGGMSSGWHTLVWDGRDDEGRGQGSGLYFMRAKSAGETSVRKMTLVK